MILEWRMSQFKSIRQEQRLELRPLTILAGANSSGKSTVIQSMLLMAQTLTSKVLRRHLVLNGELVKLGTFGDVLHEGAREDRIGLGFTLESHLTARRMMGAYPGRFYYPGYSRFEGGNATLFTDVSFGPSVETHEATEKSGRLQADVLRAQFDVRLQDKTAESPLDSDPDDSPTLVLTRRTDNEIQELLRTVTPSEGLRPRPVSVDDVRYSATLSSSARRSIRTVRRHIAVDQEPDIVSARLQHFLPVSLVDRAVLWSLVLSHLADQASDAPPPAAVTMLQQAAALNDGSLRSRLATILVDLTTAHPQYQNELLRRRSTARRLSGDVWQEMLARIEEQLGEDANLKTLQYLALPDEVDILTGLIGDFFSSVRYLGPLRDDPKPVYGIASSADPRDVGPKGQYTAAVLDLYGSTPVDIVPPNAPTGYQRLSLAQAVKAWMNYFAMADSVAAVEEGKLGHRLLIRPDGVPRDLDLTNVGVGVSQVLPLVVMCLISEPNSLLLFEQPELHLHPAVQSLLSDFFIAVARSGRQCLVETHSEYLINRLRLRVAESPSHDRLQDSMIVHFVERHGGVSTFRRVEINEYGAIPEWPSGFFDQGPNESEKILEAAQRKKQLAAQAKRASQ